MAHDNLTAAWRALQARATETRAVTLRALRDADPARGSRFAREAAGLYLDFSRQRIDDDGLRLLASLADAARPARAHRRDVARRGHQHHRRSRGAAYRAARAGRVGRRPGRRATSRARCSPSANACWRSPSSVRNGSRSAVRAARRSPPSSTSASAVRTSDPPWRSRRCIRSTADAPRVRFVSNVDGTDLANALEDADAARTLFIVASKTFSTQETLANARTARAWLAGELGEAAVPAHFAAVSTNAQAMDAFGVNPNYRFMMWDWVGGRYSLWSSIGVSLAIAIGRDGFLELLAGAHEMDEHFRERALGAQPAGAHGAARRLEHQLASSCRRSRCCRTTAACERFPAYLQQLDMESNGKSVTSPANPLQHSTAPVIWGEPGNNAQHSFFQMLHQGTPRAALDFLLPAQSSCGNPAAGRARHRQLPRAGRGVRVRLFAGAGDRRARGAQASARARRTSRAPQGPCGQPSGEHRRIRATRRAHAG